MAAVSATLKQGNRRIQLSVLSLAHLMNDWYMNYIPQLLPFLVAAGLPVTKVTILISAFTFTSSVSQPIFGYIVDLKNKRWLVYVGTLWMAVFLGLFGVIYVYTVLLIVTVLAGFGTAAFHPQASAMVSSLSSRRKGLFQSAFMAAGNIGYALTPVIIVPFILKFGLEATPFLAIPGVLVSVLLLTSAPSVSKKRASDMTWQKFINGLSPKAAEVFKIVLIVTIRSLTYFGLVTFLYTYFQYREIGEIASSWLVFLMLFAGAVGGMIGGFLSDIYGRKIVIMASLILATPLFYLFMASNGFLSYVFLAMAGASLLSSFSVTVVTAQELLPQSAALASGLMLGFGVGVGGLGVGALGFLYDAHGITIVMYLLISLPMLAAFVGFFLKEAKAS
ncbi:MAG TPA: MFS transporter [Clostridia bacterium]|nr:MFS transporter [Clostridia bacterium]